MKVSSARYLKSYVDPLQMENDGKPEFAFIGRSNVGKSSLINMLCNQKELAKTSSTPGKTRMINRFMINEQLCFVDLPGYGYARASRTDREKYIHLITDYINKRDNLNCLFVLVDSRHSPQKNDVEFLNVCIDAEVPLCIIFTKTDKSGVTAVQGKVQEMCSELRKYHENLPDYILSSVKKAAGRKEILEYIAARMKRS